MAKQAKATLQVENLDAIAATPFSVSLSSGLPDQEPLPIGIPGPVLQPGRKV